MSRKFKSLMWCGLCYRTITGLCVYEDSCPVHSPETDDSGE